MKSILPSVAALSALFALAPQIALSAPVAAVAVAQAESVEALANPPPRKVVKCFDANNALDRALTDTCILNYKTACPSGATVPNWNQVNNDQTCETCTCANP